MKRFTVLFAVKNSHAWMLINGFTRENTLARCLCVAHTSVGENGQSGKQKKWSGKMKNEEAIEALKLMQAQVEWDYPMDYAAAIDEAVKALEAQEWMPVPERLSEEGRDVREDGMSFEEVKEILKKSIDETANINEALEKTVQFIYSKGYEDGSRRLRTPMNVKKGDRDANEDICACHLNLLPVTNRVQSKDVNCE